MTVTGDQLLIKKLNKSIVLELLQTKSPLSRAQLAEISGLNKATVSSLVNELIEDELVYEIGPGESSGGRRPILLLFNKKAGYTIGVDLGVNYILSVLTDLEGNIITESMRMLASDTNNRLIEILKEEIAFLIKQTPDSRYGIVGIGIAVPGIVDDQGLVLFAPHLNWKNYKIKEEIAYTFALPVLIENEANVGALGEKLHGTGKDVKHLIYVSAGIGIGTGIIIQNELYKGAGGFSGEMGHMSIEANGISCTCGNRGCWELYASEQALIAKAYQQLSVTGSQYPAITLEALIKQAENHDTAVIKLFEQVGSWLGIGIVNMINLFNPELVVIGNRMTLAQKWLQPAMQEVIHTRSLPYQLGNARVQFTQLSTYSNVLGASALAVNRFFSANKITVE
jgi:predicted NBD/HSP70 family sugar kinase